jgi:TPR repeat protein
MKLKTTGTGQADRSRKAEAAIRSIFTVRAKRTLDLRDPPDKQLHAQPNISAASTPPQCATATIDAASSVTKLDHPLDPARYRLPLYPYVGEDLGWAIVADKECPDAFDQYVKARATLTWLDSKPGERYEQRPYSVDTRSEKVSDAFRQLRLSAAQGNKQAQLILGKCHQDQVYDHHDPEQQIFWLTKAAEQGCCESQFRLAELYRQGVEDHSIVRNDEEKSAYYFGLAAEQGHTQAKFNLAHAYYLGTGVGQDLHRASQWFHLAAIKGHANAQTFLGWCYEFGQGVSADPLKAFEWYQLAAKQRNNVARNALGIQYLVGSVVPKDEQKAAQLFQLAARSRPAAMANIGICHLWGIGTEKDERKAVYRLNSAANSGVRAAQLLLSLCFETGTGVHRNDTTAALWAGCAEANALKFNHLIPETLWAGRPFLRFVQGG